MQSFILHENYLSSQAQKFRKITPLQLSFGIRCAECLHWGSMSGLPLYSTEIHLQVQVILS